MYEVVLTRLACAIADVRYSRETVEWRARCEIDGLGIVDPTDLILHGFGIHAVENREFVYLPNEQGTGFVVDTVSYEEGGPIRSGPLKGKRLQIAKPDSE